MLYVIILQQSGLNVEVSDQSKETTFIYFIICIKVTSFTRLEIKTALYTNGKDDN